MPIYTKRLLSASTDGLQIPVTETTSPGVTIHQAVSGTLSYDEVWLWGYNNNDEPYQVTVQWGETGSTGAVSQTLAAKSGYAQVIPGMVLNNDKVISAHAGSAGGIAINGFVNRIEP